MNVRQFMRQNCGQTPVLRAVQRRRQNYATECSNAHGARIAGGIRSQDEVNQLDAMGVDAVVGMAIYSGQMKLDAIGN
jgi:uncharacterized protein related to proFAR isomerase